MPEFNVGAYLADTGLTLAGIPSTAHPAGKAYTFDSPSAKRGLWMRELVQYGIAAQLGMPVAAAPFKAVLDDDEQLDLYREVMGETLQEMLDDGVSWVSVQRVFGLLLRHYGAGRDVRDQLMEFAKDAAPAIVSAALKKAARKGTAPKAPAKKAAAKKAVPAKRPPAKSAAKSVR